MKKKKATIEELIDRTKVSSAITAIGEELREGILADVNHRIGKARRRSVWLKIGTAAASVVLLLGITNYVSYQQGYKRQNSQIVQQTTPLGMQSSITLPDGTKVFLNAGTTLTYPTAFVSKNRMVEVEGEAFFDVVHDAKHPFIVKTRDLNIQVLGTKFNVKTYRKENNVEVTLEEGRVNVGIEGQRYRQMKPGQQVVFSKETQSFSQKQVKLNHYISWKEGKFYFESMTFESIAKQLERRFNVQIHISSAELKKTIFTGDFVRQENLEQILRVMTVDKRITYKIEGDQIYIQ